jgi:hypothetical protein
MSEAAFQVTVESMARAMTLYAWHDRDSRRNNAGLPDLLLIGPNGLIYPELKTVKRRNRVTPEQAMVLRMVAHADPDERVVRARVWTPEDLQPDPTTGISPIQADLKTIAASRTNRWPRDLEDALRATWRG